MGVLVYAIVTNAWVADDAYISFRTLDNFVSGHGLTWNPVERVQAYTHPLWLLLLAPAYWMTGEIYFTVIAISFLLVIAAVGVLHRCALRRAPGRSIAFIVLLACSRSFVDYSTSGLENPLLFLLLALFVERFFEVSSDPHRVPPVAARERADPPEVPSLTLMWLLGSLIFLTRPDAILFLAPALAYSLWRARNLPTGRLFTSLCIGAAPAVLWEMFSLFYYGFPLPNTAYAKLNTGIAQLDLARQAAWYYWNSFQWDPLTLATIAAGLVVALLSGTRERLLAAGVFLYLLYLFFIGGDFMSGRFFSAPFLVCAFLLCSRLDTRRSVGFVLAGTVVLALASPSPTLVPPGKRNLGRQNGISDERAFYFPGTGLINYRSGRPYPSHRYFGAGRELANSPHRVVVRRYVGFLGFSAGPELIIIDRMALTDPLLSRLPTADPERWRIGHFERELPRGYVETVGAAENHLFDASLREYYDRLRVVTQGPLWSWRRLEAIRDLNTGRLDPLLEQYLRR